MAPQPATTKERPRSDRTTVGLSSDTIKQLDAMRKRAGLRMLESEGFEVEPSRSDIVASLVRRATAEHDGKAA